MGNSGLNRLNYFLFADDSLSSDINGKGVKPYPPQYLLCSRGVGSIQRNLYWPHLKRVVFSSPPLPEQIDIVAYLDKATADIDAAVDRARRQIELLREYRTRLIADVVTGKLDVREAQANLSDESDKAVGSSAMEIVDDCAD